MHFEATSGKLLGFVVSKKGIKIDPNKVEQYKTYLLLKPKRKLGALWEGSTT